MKEDSKDQTASDAEKMLLAVENSAHSALATARHHRRTIAIATLAVVVVSLGYALISHFQQKAEDAAWDSIFKAEFTARRQPKTADLAAQFKAADAAIANTNARFYAYMLEIAQYGAGKDKADWEKAATELEELTKDAGD